MRKLCTLILAVVLFSSCGIKEPEKENIELQMEKYEQLNVYKFNYSDHSYIMFIDKYSYYGCRSGVVHDPECSCYKRGEKFED